MSYAFVRPIIAECKSSGIGPRFSRMSIVLAASQRRQSATHGVEWWGYDSTSRGTIDARKPP